MVLSWQKQIFRGYFNDNINAFVAGPVVGKFCMDLAIEKAKNVGIGWVVAKGTFVYFFFKFKILIKCNLFLHLHQTVEHEYLDGA